MNKNVSENRNLFWEAIGKVKGGNLGNFLKTKDIKNGMIVLGWEERSVCEVRVV